MTRYVVKPTDPKKAEETLAKLLRRFEETSLRRCDAAWRQSGKDNPIPRGALTHPMSWNERLPFDEGLARLKKAAEVSTKTDRPTVIRRADIRIAHSVFQPRLFQEDLQKDQAHVEELARALKAKPKDRRILDPVLVMAIGSAFYCVDGHHRLLAYAKVGVDGAVPVEHFGGTIEDALKEAIHRNAKDRLAMTHEDKMEAAWRLVILGVHSKREIAEATGAAESTIGTMRATLRELEEADERTSTDWDPSANKDPRTMTWAEAKRALKGDAPREFTDEARAAQTREWARRIGKTFGTRPRASRRVRRCPRTHSAKLPEKLVEYWVDLAQKVAEDMAEDMADDGTSF